jgi:RHS repeat-associated protein
LIRWNGREYPSFNRKVGIVETRYEYDENRRWLKNIETVGSGRKVLQDIRYRFDREGNVAGYRNEGSEYWTEQGYEYDGLYQLTGVTRESESRKYGLMDHRARYSQHFSYDGGGLGNVERKTSATMNSDSRRVGDELDYQLAYDYEAGYAHRVSRIGTRYYRYDKNGNVVVEQDGPFADVSGAVGGTVTDLGDEVYVTDQAWGVERGTEGGGAGRVGSRREYRWDERNRLIESSDERYLVKYRYGEEGDRSGKYSVGTAGGTVSESLYFNKLWTWRYDGTLSDWRGRNSKHIYVGVDRVVTKVSRADGTFTGEEGKKQYWYHGDHLGSAQVVTDAGGNEYERIEYTPYGELWIEKRSGSGEGPDIGYRFTGKERDDETGLYYYGARYLDTKSGRWLSTDPAVGEYIPAAGGKGEDLPGMGGVYNLVNLHPYHYAGNNPVKYTDPDGRVVLPIPSQYLMQNYTGTIPAGNGQIQESGCAIMLGANIAHAAGAIDITPDAIRLNEDNFNSTGLRWGNALSGTNVTPGPRLNSQLSVATYNELDASATEYYIGIMVNYTGNAANEHWVGVTGTYSEEGVDYFVISGTSVNDSNMGNNPGGNNRGGMGWRNVEGVGTVVPTDAVTAYRVFTVSPSNE